MTGRERILIGSLGLSLSGLTGLFLWQQARYTDAHEAIRRFVRLEQQLEPTATATLTGSAVPPAGAPTPAPEADPEQVAKVALLRQAQPELRRALVSGTFRDALRRLDALDQENVADLEPEARGKALAVEALWPPRSPERAHAREVLRLLVERLKQGYDLADAQDALVSLAEKARAGQKTEALAAFSEVEKKVREASLRPGFRPTEAGKNPRAGQAADGGGQVTAAQVQQMLHVFRVILPQAIQQAPPAQQGVLRRLEPLGTAFDQAVRQGKDVTAAVRIARRIGPAIQSQDLNRADRLITALERALRDAPPQACGKPGANAPAGAGGIAKGGGKVPAGGAAPSSIPPATAAGAPALAQLLQAMDGIRRMPEPAYQQQRLSLAMLISQAMASRGGAGGIGGRGGGRQPALAVGTALGLRMILGPQGEIRGLAAGETLLSQGISPGGLALRAGSQAERPLQGTVTRGANGTLLWSATGPEGSVAFSTNGTKDGVAVQVKVQRTRSGAPARLVMRIPFHAGGWRWGTGEAQQVIAVDGSYSQAAVEGRLPDAAFQGAGTRVTVQAPAASAITYDPAKQWLTVEFELPPAAGAYPFALSVALSRP